jgi:hypothetical protein
MEAIKLHQMDYNRELVLLKSHQMDDNKELVLLKWNRKEFGAQLHRQ